MTGMTEHDTSGRLSQRHLTWRPHNLSQHPRGGSKVPEGVLCIDPDLDGPATGRVCSLGSQIWRGQAGHLQLQLPVDEVQPRHHLCDAVLHLQRLASAAQNACANPQRFGAIHPC